jgi:hypothetical protein
MFAHFTDAADGTDDILGMVRPTFVMLIVRVRNRPSRPKEGLRPPESASERAWALGPAWPSDGICGSICTDPQQVGCTSRPLNSVGHDLTYARRHRVSIDNVLDRLVAVVEVSSFKRTEWSKLALTRCRPKREVGHAWQMLEAHTRQHL